MRNPDLQTLARNFADSITGILNATITDGLRLTPVVAVGRKELVFLGFKLAKDKLVAKEAFPLNSVNRQSLFISVYFRLELDPEGQYLTVGSSSFGVYESADVRAGGGALFRYEYERNKADGYPEAHLHARCDWSIGGVPASSTHLPLGDRRYRPCLEDVIQYLIVEGACAPRNDHWRDTLDATRNEFHEGQFRAAIRRNPELARSVLADLA
jgi:hypothetical protein